MPKPTRDVCNGPEADTPYYDIDREYVRCGLKQGAVQKPHLSFREGAMKLPRRRFLHLAAGAAALPVAPHVARAQAYPTRPVRIVVAFPPGSTSDIVIRPIGARLQERLGQPAVIDNRSGAGGNIGTEAVVRAPADGYTLL